MQIRATTLQGEVEGETDGEVVAFRGIPYAAPPIGPRRWAMPEAPEAWDGVRQATSFGNIAPQMSLAIPSEMTEAMPLMEAMIQHEPTSEDCLYANVWTPSPDDSARPVMVWVHGGAFIAGAGSQPVHNGRYLSARGDVVVVTLNYRLGPFGFLRLGAATDGQIEASGSEGLADIIAGLQWVADNIASFGGDPSNVCVFGQSAGAIAINGLLASLRARGLFKRAIVQSGTVFSHDRAHADLVGALAIAKLRAMSGDFGWRELGTDEWFAATPTALDSIVEDPASAYMLRSPWLTADGDVLPGPVLDAVAAGSAAGVEILAGSTRDEFKSAQSPFVEATWDTLPKILHRIVQPGVDIDALIDAYRAARPLRMADATPAAVGTAIHCDSGMRMHADRLLGAQRPHGSVYQYLYAWSMPFGDGALGAPHASEIPLVFGTHNDRPAYRQLAGCGPAVDAFSDALIDAWTSFARSGNPSTDALGEWPTFGEDRSTMLLGERCEVVDDPYPAERKAWDHYPDEVFNRPMFETGQTASARV